MFEALKVQNMTRRPKPKQDPVTGKWLRNGAAAKAGLNKAILASAWGQTKVFLQYKARRSGKAAIEVPAFYSSQECSACGHTHKDNRPSQAEFACLSCGHKDNADHNAANVIAARGVRQLLGGQCVKKEKKTCRITKQKVGAKASEPMAFVPSTPGEIVVRRLSGNVHSAMVVDPGRIIAPLGR